MSEIKALDNLRNWAKKYGPMGSHDPLMFADEIEREISERYVLLPCDADGEPWTLETERFIDNTGRKVKFSGLQVDREGRWKILSICVWYDPSLCRHVKPDPLKELLTEMLDRNSDGIGYSEFGGDFEAFVKSYAERIRELMGGDAS